MSWLDDFKVENVHECVDAYYLGDNYDDIGNPTAWTVGIRALGHNERIPLVTLFDWWDAREVILRIRRSIAMYQRLTA